MLRGKIFYRGEFVEAGIEVEEGRIVRIGKLVDGKKVEGIILPAAIDVHVHFRDFKEKHKETIESGSLAALHGGVCLVVDQPNTKPLVDDFAVYEERMKIAEKKSYIDYSLNLALTNENAGNIGEIVEKIKEKYYLPAIGEVFIQYENENLQIGYDVLRKAASANVKMTVHAEDPKFVAFGTPNFMYRKREAEIVAVKRCMEIADFHFCHISTRDAAEMLAASPSTFEVTPHHLLLSEKDYSRLGDFVNVNPPLRKPSDAEWLLRNFCKADVLASDHAPHTPEDKQLGAAGFPGVETMYPMFVALAAKGIVSFSDLVEKLAENPAKIFRFDGYGSIEVGNFANFAVFNLKRREKISADKLHSLCGWTPFEGFEAIFPIEVYIRGEEVLQSGERVGRVISVVQGKIY